MEILRKKPGEPWEKVSIEATEQAVAAELGGEPAYATLFSDAKIAYRKTHRGEGLSYNTTVCGVAFSGTVLFVGASGFGKKWKLCDLPSIDFMLKSLEAVANEG